VIRALPAALTVLAAALCAVPAHADDASPTTTVTPAPLPTVAAAPAPTVAAAPAPNGIGNPLAQSGDAPTGPFGLPDLSAAATGLLLGQNPVPAAPDATAPAKIPSLAAFDPHYLLPQYVDPAPPGQGELAAGIGPTPDDPSTGRIAFLRRLHEMYAEGELRGALLGQQSAEEFLAAQLAAESAPPDES